MRHADKLLLEEVSKKEPSLARIEVFIADHANVNVQDKKGVTPLMLASLGGHSDIVSTLLRSGADPAVQCHEKETALMYAACAGNYGCVALLLQNEPHRHINLQSIYGNNALFACARGWPASGFRDIVTALIKAGIDIDHKDPDGRTALDYALSNKEYLKKDCTWLRQTLNETRKRYDPNRVSSAVLNAKAPIGRKAVPRKPGPR